MLLLLETRPGPLTSVDSTTDRKNSTVVGLCRYGITSSKKNYPLENIDVKIRSNYY